jgi:opacity protein-like surface antigen
MNLLTKAFLFFTFILAGTLFAASKALAQDNVITSEIGVGLGGVNYKGELAPTYKLGNNQPALNLFFRRDVSKPITLKGSLLLSHGILADKTFSDNKLDLPLHNFRQAESKLSLAEVAVITEYNFLDYYDLTQKVRVAPYLYGGVSGIIYNVTLSTENQELKSKLDKAKDTNVAITIPFGVGVKFALSKYWNLGLEFGARKMFTDVADDLSENEGKRLANPFDNDMLYYNGISLSYTIYQIKCPRPYKNTPGILD